VLPTSSQNSGSADVSAVSILDAPLCSRPRRWPWVFALSTHTALALVTATLVAHPQAEPPAVVTEVLFIDVEPEPEPEPAPEKPLEPAVVSPAPPKLANPTPMPKPEPAKPEPPQPEPAAPQAAQAGQVLTRDFAVLDLSNTFVVGAGAKYAGGTTDSTGTATKAVRNPSARGSAMGGTGTGPATPGLVLRKGRPPRLAGGASWNCPFPPEADLNDVNQALVTLQVSVAANGAVNSADVRNDPGHGFGRAARRCALTKRWDPGLDALGQPTAATAVVNVRFQR
jgi:periplasmic protein TonB